MKKLFNRNTITIKLDACHTHFEGRGTIEYDSHKTELKHDALTALLLSGNPLRNEYNIDFDLLSEQRAILDNAVEIISEMLNNSRKGVE